MMEMDMMPNRLNMPDLIGESSVNSSSEIAISSAENEDSSFSNKISKKETKAVLHLKLFVLSILVVSASTIASCAYVYISRSEISQFESKFNSDAEKVLEAIGSSLYRTLGLLDSVSVTYISYASDHNDSWPFVTLPDFGTRMVKLLPLTDAVTIYIAPIVYPAVREQWEAYSLQNDEWVNQSIAVQEKWDGYYGQIDYDWEPYSQIYGDSGVIETNVSRFMLPLWQSFPVVTDIGTDGPYNWDWRSAVVTEHIELCISNQKSVLSNTYLIPNPNDPQTQAESEYWIEWFKALIDPNENPFEPIMDLLFPVIDNSVRLDESKNRSTKATNGTVVAVIAVAIYWRDFFRDILPTGSDGIVIVVECPCNEMFTYQIDGSKVKYLGIGDAHDAKYNHLAKTRKLMDLKTLSSSESYYSGPAFDESYCPYSLHLYPSDVMESDFTTNKGVIFMVSTILIFMFTSMVFYLYDWMVERRQSRVVSTARQSSALLSSLFPDTVRDQLYLTQSENQKVKSNKWSFPAALIGAPTSDNHAVEQTNASPIAQLYTDTTVIFMDIVGFTHWSSTRQPCGVFELLETIYGRFDSIAKAYGVFKIETIGDSYVAVVGLPSKKKHHAVIMARFAGACREQMKEVMTQLEESLGEGTTDLTLRIGMNSGPTTAGVLRGEKARFQLFGDTVNTAARMESNGQSNKIHISQSTAILLQSAGYGHWLVERPDKITAKGKGLMQTYWCEPEFGEGKSTVGSD